VFRVAPNQALIATKYGDWIAAGRLQETWAFVFEKTDGGQRAARDVTAASARQARPSKYEGGPGADPNSTEFTAQIERFQDPAAAPFDFFH